MTGGLAKHVSECWPALPSSVRAEVAANLDSEPLSTAAIEAVTRARGIGPAAVSFVEAEPAGSPRFYLTQGEYEWTADVRELDATRAQLAQALPDDASAMDRAVPRADEAFRQQFPPPEGDIRTIAF